MTIKNWIKSTNQGFTLVELMVVVAIIGLLSAVAVPNFKKYQAKAKTSEAKLQLSAIYMSEQSFTMDYNGYGTCLNVMGFDPSLEFNTRYYFIGFQAGNAAAHVAAQANQAPAACTGAGAVYNAVGPLAAGSNIFQYGANKRVNNFLATSAHIPATAIVGASPFNTFIAGAAGVITDTYNTAANSDYWTINETKTLLQVRVGY